MANEVSTRYVEGIPAAIRRISWGAVFAGVIVALMVGMVLNLLGVGIGLSTIDPLHEQSALAGLGIGAALWLIACTLISLFAGGWVAGHLAGIPYRTDAALHGVLTWGVTTLVTVFFFATAAGGLFSGATRLLAGGVSGVGQELAGQDHARVEPSGEQPRGFMGMLSSLNQQRIQAQIKEEARQLVQSGAGQSQPPTQQPPADQTQPGQEPAGQTEQAQMEVNQSLDRLFASELPSQVDRNATVVVIERYTGDRAQAEQAVDRWINRYQEARMEATGAGAEAEQQVREIGATAAEGAAKAAWFAFFALLLGGLAAAFGGTTAMPKVARVESRTATRTV
jgi:hypothetical protein